MLKKRRSVLISLLIAIQMVGLCVFSNTSPVQADTIEPISPGTIVWHRITGPWDFTDGGSCGLFGAIAVDPSNPKVIYLGHSSTSNGLGMYKSIDGGINWLSINNGIRQIGLTTKYYPAISKIVISRTNPTVLYLGTYMDGGFGTTVGYIYRSTDGGNSWSEATGKKNWLGIPQIQGGILDISIDPTDPNTLIASDAMAGVFKTSNGGKTWTRILTPSQNFNGPDIYHVASVIDHNVFFTAGVQNISGFTIPLPVVEDLDFTGALPIGPLITSNGGKKWIDVKIPEKGFISGFAVNSSNHKEMYFSTLAGGVPLPFPIIYDNHGVYKSQDGGVSWQAMNNADGVDLSTKPIYNLSLDQYSPTNIYLTVVPNVIYHSNNAGDSWKLLPSPVDASHIQRIYANNGRIFALTSIGIFVCDINQPAPVNYSLSVMTQGQGSVSLSPSGGSYPSGATVTLTATAASDWQFSGWSGDLTGSQNPATITMNSNKSVTATFSQTITPPTLSPTHVSPSNGATGVSTSPIFQWQPVAGATKYGFYISKPPYGAANLVYEVETLTGTSLTLPITLQEGVTYYWNMRAGNSAGWGPFSTSWSFTTRITSAISVGSSIRATANVNVRTSPTVNQQNVIKTMPNGSTGVVINGPVSADNFLWWQIRWNDGTIGWSVQDYLAKT